MMVNFWVTLFLGMSLFLEDKLIYWKNGKDTCPDVRSPSPFRTCMKREGKFSVL